MQYGPLQVQPQGLLGFLQLKNQGKNPNLIPDTLQCVLEQFDWFMQTNDEAVDIGTLTVANAVVGDSAFATPVIVPQGEYWYVTHFGLRTASLVSTDSIRLACAYVGPVGGGFDLYQLSEMSPALVSGPDTRAYSFVRGFWLPPGSELVCLVGAVGTATTITVSGSLRRVVLHM